MAELIIALDTDSAARALQLAALLRDDVHWFKVGLELFVAAGPELVAALKALGPDLRVFLDLKFYDIPTTASRAALAAVKTGADMLTVHCQGGERMCRAVAQAVAREHAASTLVMGVTALTSFESGEMPGVVVEPAVFGRELAGLALAWGLGGVICSGHEAASIRAVAPGLRIVCPGIRPAGSEVADQRRVMTPAQAVSAGADFLVVGRPVTGAVDPAAAARAILAEMNSDNGCSMQR